MKDLRSIAAAVRTLNPAELKQFREWFAGFEFGIWDRQIDLDARSGKLSALEDEARVDYALRRNRAP